MVTIVTSILKRRIETDGRIRLTPIGTMNAENTENAENATNTENRKKNTENTKKNAKNRNKAGDMTLFHVSHILALRKRRLLRHFLLP